MYLFTGFVPIFLTVIALGALVSWWLEGGGQFERKQRRLLARHFLDRFFSGELVSRQAEARITLIHILVVLTVPGFVISAGLINKYAALAHGPEAAGYLAALDDKTWFLYFSMVVMGFVTVLEWDSLFPDRRDYLILASLPIGSRTVLAAKVKALFQFLLLFTVFVNLMPALLFPFIAGGGPLVFLARFVFSHVVSVFAGNAFVFLSLIALQGLLMSLLGPGAFRKISRLVQFLLLVSLLTLFFLMPIVSFAKLKQSPVALALFPPAWFLGLYETLLRGRTPEFAALAWQAVAGLSVAGLGFTVTYLAAYRRHVRRVLEGVRTGTQGRATWREALGSLAQRILFRSAGERAVFNFILRTLMGSEKHRVYLGAYLGVGVAFVAMGVISLVGRHGYSALHEFRSELLSTPLVLAFFTLVGMRAVFAIPARLEANWIFRLTEQSEKRPYLAGVHRAMLFLGAIPVMVAVAPFCVLAWGWRAAGLHMIYATLLVLLLLECLIFRLDKIPFTCTYLPGKANLRLLILPYIIAFTTYAYTMTRLELHLVRNPARFATFACAAFLLLVAAVVRRHRRLRGTMRLVYEVRPLRTAEPLNLGSQ